MVLDGTGAPAVPADVLVDGGWIAAVVRRPDPFPGAGAPPQAAPAGAETTVDAAGLVVAPGFIDTHSHSELAVFADPPPAEKALQGITLEIFGQDGLSVAPAPTPEAARLLAGLVLALDGDLGRPWPWRSAGEFLDALDARGLPVHAAYLIPHAALRVAAMGEASRRPPTRAELDTMRGLLADGLAAGACGWSTGLIYPPCAYADTDELVALATAAAVYGRPLVVHLRDEGARILEAIEEMKVVARHSGCPVHISHLKVAGRANWHLAAEVLWAIDGARNEGLRFTADCYPYTAGSTTLTAVLPPWMMEGGTGALLERLRDPAVRARVRMAMDDPGTPGKAGPLGWENRGRTTGWENIVIAGVATETNRGLEGRSVAAIAEARGVEPIEAVMDLLLEEGGAVTMLVFHGSEENVRRFLRHPVVNVCTDGIYGGRPHPRLYGAFPRVLARYVREAGVLTLPQAVHKMTGLPALTFGFGDRGRIAPGMRADLVCFDAGRVADRATYEDPKQPPDGIPWVMVDGTWVVAAGRWQGLRAGRAVRLPPPRRAA